MYRNKCGDADRRQSAWLAMQSIRLGIYLLEKRIGCNPSTFLFQCLSELRVRKPLHFSGTPYSVWYRAVPLYSLQNTERLCRTSKKSRVAGSMPHLNIQRARCLIPSQNSYGAGVFGRICVTDACDLNFISVMQVLQRAQNAPRVKG